jgi:hypothetical protein
VASEQIERAAQTQGALRLTFTVVVLPSQRAELVAEGKRVWDEKHPLARPGGYRECWTDNGWIQYALQGRATRGQGDE